MITVCIESPLAGDYNRNVFYARACMKYCFDLDVTPFASHLLYPQILDDENPKHREMGIEAGIAFGNLCDERWFFTDFGMSEGMQRAWIHAQKLGQARKAIKLGDDEGNWEANITPSRGFWNEPPEPSAEVTALELIPIIRRLEATSTPHSETAYAISHLTIACGHLNQRK